MVPSLLPPGNNCFAKSNLVMQREYTQRKECKSLSLSLSLCLSLLLPLNLLFPWKRVCVNLPNTLCLQCVGFVLYKKLCDCVFSYSIFSTYTLVHSNSNQINKSNTHKRRERRKKENVSLVNLPLPFSPSRYTLVLMPMKFFFLLSPFVSIVTHSVTHTCDTS